MNAQLKLVADQDPLQVLDSVRKMMKTLTIDQRHMIMNWLIDELNQDDAREAWQE